MKKIAILLLTAVLLSAGVSAQSRDVKEDQKVLKNTIKDKKYDKHTAGKNLENLRIKRALRNRKEVRRHRRSIHRQGKHLERHGVRHPIHKAKVQAKADKDKKNGRD